MALSKSEREELINEAQAIRKQYREMKVNNEFTQEIKDWLQKRYREIDRILRIDAIPIEDDKFQPNSESTQTRPPSEPPPLPNPGIGNLNIALRSEAEMNAGSPPDETSLETSTDTKVCPMCAEIIKRAAVKCRYCGHMLDQAKTYPIIPTYDSSYVTEIEPLPPIPQRVEVLRPLHTHGTNTRLQRCPDCGEPCSADAIACPSCGRQILQKSYMHKEIGCLGVIYALIVLLGLSTLPAGIIFVIFGGVLLWSRLKSWRGVGF